MKNVPTVSLMLSTYNWPEALSLCLKSIAAQSTPPTEILIADDGSGEATRRVVEAFAATSKVVVKHIWHEDDGFRLSTIRNKAIAAASSDYIIQIDGDLILHRDFVGDHLAFARCGSFVTGSRVLVDKALANDLIAEQSIAVTPFSRGVRNRLNGMRMPFITSLLEERGAHRVRGCNMAFWRDDLLRINGYNEVMTGWGYEDLELAVRLRNIGDVQRTMKFRGIVYHLHHNFASRDRETINYDLYQETISLHLTRCEKGVGQYLTVK